MEGFFYEACKIDRLEVTEMLLRRYQNIDYILRMKYDEFIEFYNLAKEKEKEERFFLQWVQQMPFMSKDNFVPFEDYKTRLSGKNVDRRSTQEILADIDEIERTLERG